MVTKNFKTSRYLYVIYSLFSDGFRPFLVNWHVSFRLAQIQHDTSLWFNRFVCCDMLLWCLDASVSCREVQQQMFHQGQSSEGAAVAGQTLQLLVTMLNGLVHQIPSGAAVQVSSPMPTTTEVGVLIAAKAEVESKLIVVQDFEAQRFLHFWWQCLKLWAGSAPEQEARIAFSSRIHATLSCWYLQLAYQCISAMCIL